jgi:hypothetical protein
MWVCEPRDGRTGRQGLESFSAVDGVRPFSIVATHSKILGPGRGVRRSIPAPGTDAVNHLATAHRSFWSVL